MTQHRDPAPVFRFHAMAGNTLGNTGQPDTPEARAKMERVLDAADAFEVVNGRVIQVRHPVTGLPLAGLTRGF
jgi:hypothetical protein